MAANRNYDSTQVKAIRNSPIAPVRPSKSIQVVRPKEKRNVPSRRSPQKNNDTEIHERRQRRLSDANRLEGNLILMNDTWTRLKDDASRGYPLSKSLNGRIQEESNARIEIDCTKYPNLDNDPEINSTSNSRTWKVTSPIQFEYRVVEAPNLLSPDNDALIYGHLNSKERLIAKLTPR